MISAIELVFQMPNPQKPDELQTDIGKEILNNFEQIFLKCHGVLHLVSHMDQKAAIVERFKRAQKTNMDQFQNQSNKYLLINCPIL